MTSVSIEGETVNGYNEIKGYGNFDSTVKPTLSSSFVPDIPDIDPMVSWKMKQRDDVKDELNIKECDSFKVSKTDYEYAFTRSHQKGYKATKKGVHATITEKCQTELIKARSSLEESKTDEKPTQEEMNKEYNRYQYGYQMYPENLGTNLDGAKPVLLMGNQIVYQPPIAAGGGEGGRRAGYQQNKYALPIAPQN